MDVVLQTNTANPSLVLENVRRFADESGYGARVTVRSGAISGEFTFSFEPFPLAQFLAAVEAMDQTLAGEALLKPMWEPDFIRLELTRQGAVLVSGEFQQMGGAQLLRFSFKTDQTCLRPLAKALRACQQLQLEP
jgi:hypothetical protein